MWEECDNDNYHHHQRNNVGQICNDSFSAEIEKYASDVNYKAFLEIGTWNGMGSTRAFAKGLSQRSDDYVFYSLECNKDKWADAVKLYDDNKQIHILNEVIWNVEPADFYEVFPQCKTNELYKKWNDVDIINMKRCGVFLDRKDLPAMFDVILLDGGEFTTYYEFKLLKDRCKILMLDDINGDKCQLIVKEILADPSWKILKRDNVRNGYLIAERISVG